MVVDPLLKHIPSNLNLNLEIWIYSLKTKMIIMININSMRSNNQKKMDILSQEIGQLQDLMVRVITINNLTLLLEYYLQ